MNLSCSITNKLKTLTLLALTLVAACSVTTSAQAEGFGRFSNPLLIKGYNTYTNVGFIDPANPTILQVRTGGEGGVSHLGKMRSWSTDQEADLITGLITANYTFEDENGDQLVMFGTGPSAFQPDGRVTFDGTFTVVSGTGKFRRANGTLRYDGWARTTDFATGVGIGFLTIEGILYGTRIDRDLPMAFVEKGNATFVPPDFTYSAKGFALGVGKFDSSAHNTGGPFNGTFVGIVDGKFTLAWSVAEVWTTRNGDQLLWSGIEFTHFDLLILPDGSPAPDFSKPSVADIYQTVCDGTGRLQNAQGIALLKASFTPTGPADIAAQVRGAGFLSRSGK